MDYTLEDFRQALHDLRQRVHDGELFDSLGSEIGRLLDEIEYDEPTPVAQLSGTEVESLQNLLTEKQSQLMNDEETQVEDADVIEILNGLRQTDPAIRDQGVFFFITDALQHSIFSQRQLLLMTRYLLQDDVLFSHIDEKLNDGIFLRSFSVFLLSMLNYANRNQANDILGDQLRETLVEQFALYIALEHDYRGFVGDNGWAHAFMHIGNLADELTADNNILRADKLFILTLVIERIKRLDGPVVMGENRRLIGYIAHIVNMNPLYADYFLKQLKQWRQEFTRRPQPTNEREWHRFYNQNRFLQNLLLRNDLPEEIREYLNEARNFLV
ncbi:DUF2785 domain-containing protein [Weissella muntiaci]|uniref:DUF2785 domain-containing protein n=1 Tax=Weissella muntiaci TaxID=2508881 RepID=A0A6C2C820_9LACO|nr:DUF2785 domain-containing protein [Weissella muntiaci]TYC50181.1 DUF2785 domain-containing protein [Weissella muntiaci]